MRAHVQALLLWHVALVAGCSTGYLEPVRSTPDPRSSSSVEPYSFRYPLDPPVSDVEALEELLTGYRREGRVVLVHFWSSANQASRDWFGVLIDLHRKQRAYGLQCLSVAFDNPGLWTSELAPFLRSVRCTYPCLIIRPSRQGEVVARLAYQWDGKVPAALVFDRDGNLAEEFLSDTERYRMGTLVEDVLAGRHRPLTSRPGRPGLVTARSRTLDLGAIKTIGRSSSRGRSLDDVESMAKAIAERCESTIDWDQAKVAVLPFTLVDRPNRQKAGKALADAVARVLSAKHPGAIVDRAEADALLARYRLTPLGVEFDPTVLSGKARWTHIITGTLGVK